MSNPAVAGDETPASAGFFFLMGSSPMTEGRQDVFRPIPDSPGGRPSVASLIPLKTIHLARPSKAVHGQELDNTFHPFKVTRKNGMVIVSDLPICDEHDVFDEDGKFVVRCDTKMLRWIAANNNKRIKETGDSSPFTLGHTKDNVPEHLQPPIVGHATGFYVAPLVNPETLEPTGRDAIYVKEAQFPEEDVEKYNLKKFQRRSVEIWFDKDPIIDPIALLGATTPERDLGLMRLSRNGKRFSTKVLRMAAGRLPEKKKRAA